MRKINIAKANAELELDDSAWPANSKEYVYNYGLTQMLNDTIAGYAVIGGQVCINKKPLKDTSPSTFEAICLARVQKKIDALESGDVRAAGTRVGDPVKADAVELAIEMTVRGAFKKAGKPLDAKAMRAAAIELVGRNPAYLHLAQKRADEAATLAAELADMDLDELETEE